MRAQEFVTEDKVGKIGNRKSVATVGLNKFRDAQFADRVYELNRVMMAVATTDGTNDAVIDGESWAGRHNIAAPYTEVEQNMLKQAFRAAGAEYDDVNNGDMDSQEMNDVNKQSPVKGFRGYPR